VKFESKKPYRYYCNKCDSLIKRKRGKGYRRRPEIIKRRKEQGIKYYKENKERFNTPEKKRKNRESNKKRYYKNREELLKINKIWMQNNKERRREWDNNYRKNKRDTSKEYNIKIRLRTLVYGAFKKYTKSGKIYTSNKYGIDYKAIIEHLKPFPTDLSKYQIDHIIPLCSFKFVHIDGSIDLNEIQKAFAPKNHQWLTAEENQKKGAMLFSTRN